MNGIIIIDKPPGRTSHDMVNFVRRLTGIKKVGHTGTLDPMATGVLPVCVGSATKVADMLTLSDKCYVAELVLGMTTDTQDAEGDVLTECAVACCEEEIREAVESFVGQIEQIPPMYSAIKQNGKKLYELARKGIEVERKSRIVTIHSIDILKIQNERVSITVQCSKGTYIRTLCEDIGIKLRVGAYMNTLRRVSTGPFTIEESHTTDELLRLAEAGQLESVLIPVDRMFEEYESVSLNPKQVRSVINGVAMTYRRAEGLYRVYEENGRFLCIGRIRDGKLKSEKAFWN